MKLPLPHYALLLLAVLVTGCASAPEQKASDFPEPTFTAERIRSDQAVSAQQVYDPWEGMNKRFYNFNYHFDQKVFLPVVRGWKAVVPQFMRSGISNFFENQRDIVTMFNSALQGSPEKLAQSTGRVLVNSTVGLLGLVDVATKLDFPRPQEDFGQTLGRWGVGKGPYLVMPFLGPSNVRDGLGKIPDFLVINEVNNELLSKPLRATIFLFDAIDTRSNLRFRYHETGSAFEYETVRWLFSTKRDLDVIK